MTVVLHCKQKCAVNGSFIVKLCVVQSWVLTVPVLGSADMLAGPDAGDLFPHQ